MISVLKERGGCEGLLGGSALARDIGRLPQGHDDLKAEYAYPGEVTGRDREQRMKVETGGSTGL